MGICGIRITDHLDIQHIAPMDIRQSDRKRRCKTITRGLSRVK